MAQRTDAELLSSISNIKSLLVSDGKIDAAELQSVLNDLVDSLRNNLELPLAIGTLTTGQVLKWNGTAWTNGADEQGSGSGGGVDTNTALVLKIGVNAQGTPSSGSYDALTIGPLATTAYAAVGQSNDSDGPEKLAIGYKATAPQWRGHAIGAYAAARAVSSLAIGPKSLCDYSHGVAVGRGAMMPIMPGNIEYGNIFGGEQSNDFGIANWWGHRFPDHPISGDAVAADITPASVTKIYHGQNAYDAKDGTSVNIAGGHARLQGGLPTGGGLPGRVELATASQFNNNTTPGGNVQKPPVVYLMVDGIDSDPEAIGIQIRVSGNMRRIYRGEADSGGTGYRVLRVLN
jgi:hypothetical protein